MHRKIKKFTDLDRSEKRMFVEAFIFLAFMRAALLSVSFKRLTRSLKAQSEHDTPVILNESQLILACDIGTSVEKAANHTPWKSSCLVQALAAQKMLANRKIRGILYLGVNFDNGTSREEKLNAHAWLQCGNSVITGKTENNVHKILSSYSW